MPDGLEGLLAGRTLVKRYEIGEVIGRGGFAVVYRATDTRLGRSVAVKVITLTAHDEAAREKLRQRLHREARAAAGLPHHPNLVTVHDVGTDPELGLDFLVMELLSGENLSQYLSREGKPPLALALRVLEGAAAGVAVGHRAGLVHRDVKPGNLFLAAPHDDESGPFRVCVLDYGIAQAMEDDATMTRGDALPLSPAYASPEQLRGERELRPASDVFSLGVVGYQLLTGERPFSAGPGQAPTGWTVRRPIRELNPEVAPAVEAVLMRAMREDPAERFADADAFADALDRAVRGEEEDDATRIAPALAAGALADEDDRTLLAPPVAAAPAGAAPVRDRPPLSAPPPRRRRAWPVALILALLLAGVAAWAALSGGGAGDPEPEVSGDTAASAAPVDGEPAGTPAVIGTAPDEPSDGPAEGAPETTDPAAEAPPGEDAPAPAEPADTPPARPQPAEPQPEQPQPQTPPSEPAPPPARQPRTPETPAQPPVNPPRPVPEQPVQPVIVQPRPAPRDTIVIGPPR